MKHIKELILNEAYVTNEKTKQVREDLKREFPDFKFSVRKENYSAVDVHILSGPIPLTDKEDGYEQVNHFWIKDHCKDNPEKRDFLLKVTEIINKGNWDKSDIMTDYFDVGFYVNLTIGQWDKPYEVTTKNKKIRDLDQQGIDDYLSKHKPKIPIIQNEPESRFKEFHKEKSFEKNNTKNMKHIKEFKLNENENQTEKYEPITLESIQDSIICGLIDDKEYTDVYLEKPKVKILIEECSKNIMGELNNMLEHIENNMYYQSLLDELENLGVAGYDSEGDNLKTPRYDSRGSTPTYDSRGGIFPR